MRRYAISGLALTVLVLGGCGSAPTRVGLDPDVEYVAPVASVVYAPPTTTIATAPHHHHGHHACGHRGRADTGQRGGGRSSHRSGPDRNNHHSRTGHHRGPCARLHRCSCAGDGGRSRTGHNCGTVPGTVVSTLAPAAVPQTVRADEIETQRVRANTIYANKIEANEILGVIHQDRNLKVGNTKGDIKGGPEVVASVIYADEIRANSVVADHIYVRNIRRR